MPPKNPTREKRLAAALRQNLRRRKEAGRARAKPETDTGDRTKDAAPEQPDRVPKTD
jgi:hypothetical protein